MRADKPPETRPRSAPLALWRGARAFLETLFSLFGAPQHIAQAHVFSASAHALIAAWLRAGETILRQLLLVEAAALPQTDAPPPKPRQSVRASRTTPPALLDAPETWRVSFRCCASTSGGAGGRWREHKSAKRFFPSFPIAARLEAMLRVFNDPAPFAQRLARRIARRPRRAYALLREPPPRNGAPRACAEIDGLLDAAWKAWARLDPCTDTS
jgi:hypothetical protein